MKLAHNAEKKITNDTIISFINEEKSRRTIMRTIEIIMKTNANIFSKRESVSPSSDKGNLGSQVQSIFVNFNK